MSKYANRYTADLDWGAMLRSRKTLLFSALASEGSEWVRCAIAEADFEVEVAVELARISTMRRCGTWQDARNDSQRPPLKEGQLPAKKGGHRVGWSATTGVVTVPDKTRGPMATVRVGKADDASQAAKAIAIAERNVLGLLAAHAIITGKIRYAGATAAPPDTTIIAVSDHTYDLMGGIEAAERGEGLVYCPAIPKGWALCLPRDAVFGRLGEITAEMLEGGGHSVEAHFSVTLDLELATLARPADWPEGEQAT